LEWRSSKQATSLTDVVQILLIRAPESRPSTRNTCTMRA